MPAAVCEQICQRYKAGEGVVQLAEAFSVHRTTINSILQRAGITLRVRRALTDEQVGEAARRFSTGQSPTRIARHLGVDPKTIVRCLRLRASGVHSSSRSSLDGPSRS